MGCIPQKQQKNKISKNPLPQIRENPIEENEESYDKKTKYQCNIDQEGLQNKIINQQRISLYKPQKQQENINFVSKFGQQFEHPLNKLNNQKQSQENNNGKNSSCDFGMNQALEKEINLEDLFDQMKGYMEDNQIQQDIESQKSRRSLKRQLSIVFKKDGQDYQYSYEQDFKLPIQIEQYLQQNNIQDITADLKVSMLGHKSNSIYTKAYQYLQMVYLNNFNPKEFTQINSFVEKFDTQNLIYSQQFTKYRHYQYFKKKEMESKLLGNREQEISDEIEEAYQNSISENNFDIRQTSREITMLALKQAFSQKGINVIFKHPEDSIENEQEQMISCASKREFYNNQVANRNDQDAYNDIQKHISQTGFNLETYYSLHLQETEEWYYEKVEEQKQKFAQFFKQQIAKQVKGIKEEDILIFDIQKGSIIINFCCNKNIENIVVMDQKIQKIPKKSIISQLEISEDIFDPEWDMEWEQNDEEYFRGNINGIEQRYYLPFGYYGLGLQVTKNQLYPNDGWFNTDTSDQTWPVLFHKTNPDAVQKIIQGGFIPGIRQLYNESQCRFGRGAIGEGVYFSDQIEFCEEFGEEIQIGSKYYSLIFQCRVNPKTIKSPEQKKEYYICNDPKDVRPYRILIRENFVCNES